MGVTPPPITDTVCWKRNDAFDSDEEGSTPHKKTQYMLDLESYQLRMYKYMRSRLTPLYMDEPAKNKQVQHMDLLPRS